MGSTLSEHQPDYIHVGLRPFSFRVKADTFLNSETAKYEALQAARAQVLSASIAADAQIASVPSYFERMGAQDDANELAREQLGLQERQLRLAEQAQAYTQRPRRSMNVLDLAKQDAELTRQAMLADPKRAAKEMAAIQQAIIGLHGTEALFSSPYEATHHVGGINHDLLIHGPQKIQADAQKKQALIFNEKLKQKLLGKLGPTPTSAGEGMSESDEERIHALLNRTDTVQAIAAVLGHDAVIRRDASRDPHAAAAYTNALAELAKTQVDL